MVISTYTGDFMTAQKLFLTIAFVGIFLAGCNMNVKTKISTGSGDRYISASVIESTQKSLKEQHALETTILGVEDVADFWQEEDGSEKDFTDFCLQNAVKSEAEREVAYNKIAEYLEVVLGHYNKISLDLKKRLHISGTGDIGQIDLMFGAFEPQNSFNNDMFRDKIAFYVLLNFPFRDLEYKKKYGESMSRLEWAYVRLSDLFASRVPSKVNAKISEAITGADAYISDYNIYMGNLVDAGFKTYFPKDMKLISHWNLRDELKSQYAMSDGLQHQRMIYDVMKHIIAQDIPLEVINKNEVQWNPATKKIYKKGKEIKSTPEPLTRYEWLLKSFKAQQEADKYEPVYNTYIKRTFDKQMEFSQPEIEKLFVDFVSSPVIRRAGKLIAKRLGRKLEPFDIWYNGFERTDGMSEEELSKLTRAKYPNTAAFKKDIPNILKKLGFTAAKAEEIASRIDVDPSRGAGHAWGAEMRTEQAHLRTRIAADGMDYKGYNIAVHELGHNVEQTLSLYDIDYYTMHGVPSTAFTEAWAFVFQNRDRQILLGNAKQDPQKEHLEALTTLWDAYEIMGVSLVDQRVWKWLYKNPKADKEQLKDQVIKIAKDVWNSYYADVFGVKDQTIFAIYSHMIDYPLYLSAYPIGHLAQFQYEGQFKTKPIGEEMARICTLGRYIPQIWMKKAVGSQLSSAPVLKAATAALDVLEK